MERPRGGDHWPVTDPVLSDRDRGAGSLAEMLAAGGFTLEE